MSTCTGGTWCWCRFNLLQSGFNVLHLPLRLWGWTGLFTISVVRQFNKMILPHPLHCILIQFSHKSHSWLVKESMTTEASDWSQFSDWLIQTTLSQWFTRGRVLVISLPLWGTPPLHIKDKVIKTANQKLSSHKDSYLIRFVWPESNENMSLEEQNICTKFNLTTKYLDFDLCAVCYIMLVLCLFKWGPSVPVEKVVIIIPVVWAESPYKQLAIRRRQNINNMKWWKDPVYHYHYNHSIILF